MFLNKDKNRGRDKRKRKFSRQRTRDVMNEKRL